MQYRGRRTEDDGDNTGFDDSGNRWVDTVCDSDDERNHEGVKMNDNGYMNAPATKLLATHCVCCGRPLCDSISVEMGIGPECRSGDNAGIDSDIQKIANEHVFKAAIAAQYGKVGKVREYAELIRRLGLGVLADKVEHRFKVAVAKVERSSDILIEEIDGGYRVVTPFRRKAKEEFIAAWRTIPGRRWRDGANWVPVESKAQLWTVLRQFFGGKYGKGPKGIFRIPTPEPKPEQGELFQKVA